MQNSGLIGRELTPTTRAAQWFDCCPPDAPPSKQPRRDMRRTSARNFIDLFTPEELDTLATFNERIMRHLATTDGSLAEDESRNLDIIMISRDGTDAERRDVEAAK